MCVSRRAAGLARCEANSAKMISVRFLGTAGARFVVAKQIRASGGMWFRFEGDATTHVTMTADAFTRQGL